MREAVQAPGAPAAIGPYSPAIRAGGLLFISGQIPLRPETGELVAGDVTAQTEQVIIQLPIYSKIVRNCRFLDEGRTKT